MGDTPTPLDQTVDESSHPQPPAAAKKSCNKKTSATPRLSANPTRELEKKPQEPIDIVNLAMSYGLNYGKMQGLIANQDDMGSDRKSISEAKRNVAVLEGSAGIFPRSEQT